jgi:hypothetical protein
MFARNFAGDIFYGPVVIAGDDDTGVVKNFLIRQKIAAEPLGFIDPVKFFVEQFIIGMRQQPLCPADDDFGDNVQEQGRFSGAGRAIDSDNPSI